jgi:DNA oxidative demethylase
MMSDGTRSLPPGVAFHPGFLVPAEQDALLDDIRAVVKAAPLFTPVMPRTGTPMSVRMTNCGPLGWVTDKERGYRYQPRHPVTGAPWPPIPARLLRLWEDVSGFGAPPEACLVNFYGTGAKMGLHQDRDEDDLSAPVVSISLGDDARFRIGGVEKGGPTASMMLRSGDVLVFGGASRLAWHGIDRIFPGSSLLLKDGGRLNLTLRRVTSAG